MSPLFIINPISGKGNRQKFVAMLRERGLDYVLTSAAGEAEVIARETPRQTVVAVGGDGTLNEVARGLLGTGKTLGIIPCGSGDGLARFLGISRNPRKALEVVLAGKTLPLDAGMINSHPFFSVCGVGFDADVSKAYALSGRRTLLSYVLQTLRLWKNYSPQELSISIDSRQWTQKAMLVTVANSNQWGNNAVVAPQASCNDGILNVAILDPVSALQLPVLALKLLTGRCDTSSRVHCLSGKHIVIERKAPGTAHYDGDWFDAPPTLDISIIPSAPKALVP